jgi:hypothetical protein
MTVWILVAFVHVSSPSDRHLTLLHSPRSTDVRHMREASQLCESLASLARGGRLFAA